MRVGGVAWAQHTGISAVEVSLDGGAWQSAELGNADDHRQLGAVGDHPRRSRRATTCCASGPPTTTALVQTGVEADVLPDGATGWHEVHFNAV